MDNECPEQQVLLRRFWSLRIGELLLIEREDCWHEPIMLLQGIWGFLGARGQGMKRRVLP